ILYTNDHIKEAAVIGVPDEKWGEVGKAFIVLNSKNSLDENAVLDYCKGNLAKYKIPKYVQFLDTLPKTDAGKIDKKKLLKIHQQIITS
ncbi:MAG: AMP-dependent synthetase, partial [Ignavibacteria bacterium CG22_combo_CG10-13_8_21_14_all_37_15]